MTDRDFLLAVRDLRVYRDRGITRVVDADDPTYESHFPTSRTATLTADGLIAAEHGLLVLTDAGREHLER